MIGGVYQFAQLNMSQDHKKQDIQWRSDRPLIYNRFSGYLLNDYFIILI